MPTQAATNVRTVPKELPNTGTADSTVAPMVQLPGATWSWCLRLSSRKKTKKLSWWMFDNYQMINPIFKA